MAAINPLRWLKAEDADDLSKDERTKQMRKRLFLVLGVAIGAVAAMLGLWWLLVGSHYVSTDDAYVNASSAQVTPLTNGKVLSVPVHDTQMVKRGDVLVVIDPEDAKLMVAQAEAAYGMTVRKVRTYFASVAAHRADSERTRLDYERRAKIAGTGAVSSEELSAVRAAYQAATAASQAAEALTQSTGVMDHPEVLAAKAQLDTAKLNLSRTIIRAPLDGIVTQRQVQIGQMVGAGIPLMAVVPISQVYVDANFKEGQLGKVRPGQPATLTCDLYGSSVKFHGRVAGIGGGTGSAFAVIPAQNATGNWIKVVQRIPVRIALDPAELKDHPLRVGLSMNVTIDISE
jgi:membrane fusion protein (multidrug efflux system)